MCSRIQDLTLRHHGNLVCIGDGSQAVGNDDERFPTGQSADGALKHSLVFGVRV